MLWHFAEMVKASQENETAKLHYRILEGPQILNGM